MKSFNSFLLILVFLSVAAFQNMNTYAQFPPCDIGIIDVPVVQCVDSGRTGVVSIIPGSVLPTDTNGWHLGFTPIQGQATGGTTTGTGASYVSLVFADSVPFPYAFNNTLNGHLTSQGLFPLVGRWELRFTREWTWGSGLPCYTDYHDLLIDFRESPIPCGQGTPLWIAVQTQAVSDSCEGAALVQTYSGTPPYNCIFSTGQTGSSLELNNLCAGAYSVTVEDASGQSISATFYITEQDFILTQSILSSSFPIDTLYTNPVLLCNLDFQSTIDSFYIEDVQIQGTDSIITEWVIWQQGSPFTVFGYYPYTPSQQPALSLTVFCMNGRSTPGGFQLFALMPNGLSNDTRTSSLSHFKITPNPSNDHITVQFPSGIKFSSLQILSSLGQILCSEKFSQTVKRTVSLPGETGIYFVRLCDNQGNCSIQRVVKTD